MLIWPLCVFIAAAITSALLVHGAVATREEPRIILQMLGSLARSLGLEGSIALGSAMTVSSGIWLAFVARRYRARVRKDRAAIGL